MRRHLKAALAVLFWSAGLGSPAAGWGASTAVQRRELQGIQRQLEQKKREISEFRKESEQLKRDLSRLAGQTSESRREVQGLERRIGEAERRKSELKAQLGALQLAEGHWQRVLSEEIRGYWAARFGDSGYFGRALLWQDAFRRAALGEKVLYVEGIHGIRRRTEAAQVEVARQKIALQEKTSRALEEQKSREGRYRQTQEVYLRAEHRLEETRQSIEELQNSALALTHLLKTLEKKSPYKEGAPVPLADPPNSLPWPVEGRVVSAFGKEFIPKLKTWAIHQGIRIASAAGTPVRPVKDGRVIFAGPFRSYGQVVIVDHGQAFYSVYGLLGSILRKKGDKVKPPDALGEAGASEGGGLVYFEIRHGADALDPLKWLKAR